MDYRPNNMYISDARDLHQHIEPASVALSVWAPPRLTGNKREAGLTFFCWKNLLRRTIESHNAILKPGGYMAINIADILCFKDPEMPRIMAENISRRKRNDITKEQVMAAWAENPTLNRRQTVDRRMKGNNIRGGKYETQTWVKMSADCWKSTRMRRGYSSTTAASGSKMPPGKTQSQIPPPKVGGLSLDQ